MADPMTLQLTATHLGLRDIGSWLVQVFDHFGWRDSASVGSLELAVHELAANVVDHAAPPDGMIRLEACEHHGELIIRLVDTGTAFEHQNYTAPEPGRIQERGYGLMIVEQLASSVDYQRVEQRNVWQATFPIEAP